MSYGTSIYCDNCNKSERVEDEFEVPKDWINFDWNLKEFSACSPHCAIVIIKLGADSPIIEVETEPEIYKKIKKLADTVGITFPDVAREVVKLTTEKVISDFEALEAEWGDSIKKVFKKFTDGGGEPKDLLDRIDKMFEKNRKKAS